MAKRVEGKAAIVVGGGQTPGTTIGNGRATAIVLAREGARVIVVDRRKDSAQETVDMIKGEGGEAWAAEADATSEESVRRMIAAAIDQLGGLDILHNNIGASLALGDAPVGDITEEAFDRSVSVNLKSMVYACKHALPALRESGGSIVNIASMAARNAYPLVGYKTTKAAVVALAKALARDYAKHGIRVNSIAPGSILFPGGGWDRRLQADPAGIAAFVEREIPMGRFGTVEEVANVVAFVASPRASWITGACIPVDGGQSRAF